MGDYNQWYNFTYEGIFSLASWDNFNEDIEKKIICLFSWMPCAIMNITHSGKGKNRITKAQVYNIENCKEKILSVKSIAESFKNIKLVDIDIKNKKIKQNILDLSKPLVEIFGTVGASKFLHFSFPFFFIMWDRKIRNHYKLKDNEIGYYNYLLNAKEALNNSDILNIAKNKFPNNILRGLDIYRMETIRD
ncbi:hypothetical protein KA977_06540 [Candidatus Dependentiae bacterium]|nr:hypothetical protein [Candidatus Dependentiae bacterium]